MDLCRSSATLPRPPELLGASAASSSVARASNADASQTTPQQAQDSTSAPAAAKDGVASGDNVLVAVKHFHLTVMQDPTLCALVCNEVEIMLSIHHP